MDVFHSYEFRIDFHLFQMASYDKLYEVYYVPKVKYLIVIFSMLNMTFYNAWLTLGLFCSDAQRLS